MVALVFQGERGRRALTLNWEHRDPALLLGATPSMMPAPSLMIRLLAFRETTGCENLRSQAARGEGHSPAADAGPMGNEQPGRHLHQHACTFWPARQNNAQTAAARQCMTSMSSMAVKDPHLTMQNVQAQAWITTSCWSAACRQHVPSMTGKLLVQGLPPKGSCTGHPT